MGVGGGEVVRDEGGWLGGEFATGCGEVGVRIER